MTSGRAAGKLNMQLPRRTVVWLVMAFFTLHNAEEALMFRTYLPRMRALLPETFASLAATLSYPVMLVALATVSVLAFLVVLAAATWPHSPLALWALLTLEAVVGLNVIAHVLSALLIFHGYGPGLVTAVLINAPFAIYCFRRARRERWVGTAALATVVPAALILHGPILLGGLWLASRSRS
jgi:hypothetical protein